MAHTSQLPDSAQPNYSPVGSASSRCLTALARGAWSQLSPAMLALLIWPFLIALLVWGLSAWFFWDPLVIGLAQSWLLDNVVVVTVSGWFKLIGVSDAAGLLARVMAFLLLAPAVLATGVIVIGVIAMPVVTRHLSVRYFADLQRQGKFSLWANLSNALTAGVVFVAGYLASLPLWLFPPLALIVPWLWWGWLTARIMRLDSLIEHADTHERRLLIDRHRREYWVLGLAVSALNYVPPLFLITPVLSALVFGHFSLARLRELRTQAGTATGGPTRVSTDARAGAPGEASAGGRNKG